MLVKSNSISYKFISALLCIMLVFTFTLMDIQEAQAIVPLIAISEGVLVAGAAILTAAGIQFATSDDARAAAYKFIQNLSTGARKSLTDALAIGSTIPMLPEIWAAATGHAKGLANGTELGAVEICTPGTTVNYTGLGFQAYAPIGAYYHLTLHAVNLHSGASFNLPGKLGTIQNIVNYDSTLKQYYAQLQWVAAMGSPDYPTVLNIPGTTYGASSTTTYTPTLDLDLLTNPAGAYIIVNAVTVRDWTSPIVSNGSNLQIMNAEAAYFAFDTIADHTLTNSSFTVNNYYYNNPANDWTNRNVTVPTTMTDLLTKDSSNALTDAGSLVTAPGATTTSENLLSQILTGVNALGATISGSISSAFAGDGTGSLDWTPLQMSGDLFTRKFPFSLPWDLLRAVQSLGTATTIAPVIPISINLAFFKWNANLDFSLFNPLMPTVRSLLLFMFGVGLVYGVRRLLGGAT